MDCDAYIRFQSTELNSRGVCSGVFALVNGLAFDGLLDESEERFRRSNNDWFNANLANPGEQDPSLYDRTVNPQATAWFKSSATRMLERVDGYLRTLDVHGIPWAAAWSTNPGAVIYEDEHQVVVVPHADAAELAV